MTEWPDSFEAMFISLFADCHAVMVERQRKYGPKNISRYGVQGTVVRMGDKFARLENLLLHEGRPAEDESVEDTLIDIANYATILRAQLRGWWTAERCPPLGEP